MPKRGAGQSLLVVDLESRGGARAVLEWRARRMVRRLGARVGSGDQVPQVVLHVPEGTGPIPHWLGGVRVIQALDLLSPSRLLEIYERVFARSFEVIRGSIGKVFPDVCGVGLGELNLVSVQRRLASFSVLSSVLGDLLDTGGVGACHILSADEGFARALERQIAGRAKAVSTWPLWPLLELARWARSAPVVLRRLDYRKAEQAARDAAAALLRAHGLERARARVLVVAESTPMAQMFAVVEGALTRAGVGPVVRLNFRGASGRAGGAGAVVCSCGDRGTLGLKAGLFRAQWGDAKRELRSHQGVAAFERSQDALCLEGLVSYLYVSELDNQARHLWAADTFLELLQPEVVVVGNDRGQAFVQLARRRGIPSLSVQDGVAGDMPWWWYLTADRLAATSEHLVQMLVRHGVPAGRCTVTGQPRYDSVMRSRPEDQSAARAALGLDPSKFAVLFAVQWDHGPDYVRGVVSALLAVPDIHVVLRPHPSDRRNLCQRIMTELGSHRMTLHSAGDSLSLVRACDALVTRDSTVVLEAALLGKPVITADFGGVHYAAPFIAAGIAIPVSELEELTRAVQRLASAARTPTPNRPGARQAALEAVLGPVDGRAGERVAQLIAAALESAPRTAPKDRECVVTEG